MTAWVILKRFWFVLPLVGLLITVLLQRNHITAQAGDLKAAQVHVTDLTNANKGYVDALATIKQQRVDNDAIATAVAARLSGNTVRETNTRTIIEKAAANDPAVRDWGSTPVPSGVRGALRTP
jgi:hypothetical protein